MKTLPRFVALLTLFVAPALLLAVDDATKQLSEKLIGKWVLNEELCKKQNLDCGYNAAGLQIYSLEFKRNGEKLFTTRIRPDAVARFREIRDADTTVYQGSDGATYATVQMRWEPLSADKDWLKYLSTSQTPQVRHAGFSKFGDLVEGRLVFKRADK